MKYPLAPSGYTFDAAAKTITFTGTVPSAISNIMHVANITRGVIYFQPQAGPSLTGTYAGGVLTLAASTAGHANGDSLLVVYDDGQAILPTNPNLSRGLGNVDANTLRASLAQDGPAVTALTSIDADLGAPADAAATSDTGTFSIIALIKRGLQNWTTLLARIPALQSGSVPTAPNISRGSGAVDANTARVTLATDGPTVTTLTSIDNKTPALVSGASPVLTTASPTDPTGNGTRAYDWAIGLRQAVASASTAAVAFPTLGTSREVMLHASTRCFVRMGDSNVAAASAAAGQLVLEAGERFHIRLAAGVTHFRVIRDTADGFLNVTAVV